MPVEIKELIIRTNIVADHPNGGAENAVLSEKDKRQIIDACVRRLQKMMKKQTDR